MPRIFDNIEKTLLPALRETLALSERADFCVGYFNLRGWKQVDALVEKWEGGDGHCCRLLVGMQQMPQDQLRSVFGLLRGEDEIDQATAIVLKRKLAVSDAAAVAAAYGSVSAVTFVAATSFLESQQISFGGEMVAVMARYS